MGTLKEKCEESVNSLLKYMAVNKLAANDDKTHVVVMRAGMKSLHKEKISFNIGKATVEESESEKLLGVWVSNDLRRTQQLSKLESKLRSRLYTLRQMEQVIPKVLLKRVADGIFMSVLRYGLGIFCPIRVEESDPHHSNIEGIRVVFNNMLRLLCGSKRTEHTSIQSMLDHLGWLSINQLAAEVRLIEVWKSLNLSGYSLSHIFPKFESGTLQTSSWQKKTPQDQFEIKDQRKFLSVSKCTVVEHRTNECDDGRQ